MNIHMCQLDRECRGDARLYKRAFGTPMPLRVYINTKKWHLGVALTPASRMGHIDGRSRWTYLKKK